MNMWYPVFVPEGMSQHELVASAKRAFRRFYFRPKVLCSYLRALRKPGAVTKLATGIYAMLRYQLSA
jgi:hypothetical protein